VRMRSMTRSARAPTSAGDSPPGHPSMNSCQRGRSCRISVVRRPLVIRRSPTRPGRGRSAPWAAKPASRRSCGSLQRARPPPRELEMAKALAPSLSRVALATLRQRQIRETRVLARKAPGGLAMARQVSGRQVTHGFGTEACGCGGLRRKLYRRLSRGGAARTMRVPNAARTPDDE
jgi:hypothetical protein